MSRKQKAAPDEHAGMTFCVGTAEHRGCHEWVADGVGHHPTCAWKRRSETYNADLRARLDSARVIAAEMRRVAAASDGVTDARPKARSTVKFAGVAVRFTVNGEPVPPSNNKLSRVAFHYTDGLGPDGGRLGVRDLRALIVEHAGVENPDAEPWEVTIGGTSFGAIIDEAAS